MVAHPLEQAATGTAVAIAGGPAIFLVGLVVFVHFTTGVDGFEWLVAAANLAALILIGVVADLAGLPLWVVSALVLIPMYALVGLAAWHARDARAVSAS